MCVSLSVLVHVHRENVLATNTMLFSHLGHGNRCVFFVFLHFARHRFLAHRCETSTAIVARSVSSGVPAVLGGDVDDEDAAPAGNAEAPPPLLPDPVPCSSALDSPEKEAENEQIMISNGLGKKIGLFSRTFNVPNAVRDIIK